MPPPIDYAKFREAVREASIPSSAAEAGLRKRLEDLERQLADAKRAAVPDPTYRSLDGKVAMLKHIYIGCPECNAVHDVQKMADGLRVRFRHPANENCSRTMTEFYRPMAQFIEMI